MLYAVFRELGVHQVPDAPPFVRMNQSAEDLLMGAPSLVTREQLDELRLSIVL